MAQREVVLAAGAYGSPQILMLSGISPADELASFSIPAVIDLPVGTNLQDHPLVPISFLTNEQSLFGASAADLALYHLGRGPLTSNVAEGGVFLSTRGDDHVPDSQFEMAPTKGLTAPTGRAFAMAVTTLKPTSTGRVSLRSAHPDAKPRINHNYLATTEDRITLVSAIRLAMDLLAQRSLQSLKRAPFSVPASNPGPDIMAHIEQHTGSNYHPTSTCAIGRVVDPVSG